MKNLLKKSDALDTQANVFDFHKMLSLNSEAFMSSFESKNWDELEDVSMDFDEMQIDKLYQSL